MTETATAPTLCSQNDGKQAVNTGETVPLCADCYYRTELARSLAFNREAALYNLASQDLDRMSVIGGSPLLKIPDLPDAYVFNNIKIDHSTVGVVNTANVHTIDVAISHLNQAGKTEASDLFRELTENVVNDQDIDRKNIDEYLDIVAYLSDQAAAAAKDRKKGLIKAAIDELINRAWPNAIKAAVENVTPMLNHIMFG